MNVLGTSCVCERTGDNDKKTSRDDCYSVLISSRGAGYG